MTAKKPLVRSIALTGAAFAAALTLSACAGSAEATEPTPGTQPPPTLQTTSTTIVPAPDYYPNETGGGDSSSDDSSSGS